MSLFLKQTFLTLLFSFWGTIAVVGADDEVIETLPKLGEGIVFPNHLLMKVSKKTNFFEYDHKTEKRILNFNHLITKDLTRIPTLFSERIPAIHVIKKEVVYFKSLIKSDYYFSDKWTNKNHIISIRGFEKTGTQSDISAYFGPLSNIPTSLHGMATFDLKFDGTVISFKSYASKKRFSFKDKYWAFLDVYLPPAEYADQFKLLILIVNEPNNYLKDNGTYFLVPINKDDRKRYSIQ